MQLNGFVLRLALLLLPGLIGSKIYRKLRGKTDKQSWEDFTEILLISIVSYLGYFALISVYHGIYAIMEGGTVRAQVVGIQPSISSTRIAISDIRASTSTTQPSPFQSFTDESKPLDWQAIIMASVLSLLVAFSASAIATHQFINKFGFWIKATGRQGDACVWTLFNRNYASPTEYQWAFVRDSKSNVVYFGQIRYFSDPGNLHELVLHDVTVYRNDDWRELYETRALYIARNAGELGIEFPILPANNSTTSNSGVSNVQTDSIDDPSD